jgi:hypothetical protein
VDSAGGQSITHAGVRRTTLSARPAASSIEPLIPLISAVLGRRACSCPLRNVAKVRLSSPSRTADQGQSDAEIAPLLGVTPQQVSQLWNSGFTTLRSALRADPAVWWGTRKDQPTARHDRELRGSPAERR